jgi:hypothetical protein
VNLGFSNFRPSDSTANVVNPRSIPTSFGWSTASQGVSSQRLRQEFPELVRHYWRAQRLWAGSYFAGSVGGAPISVLRQYIEQQERPVQGTLARSADSRARLHHRPEGRRTSVHFDSERPPRDAGSRDGTRLLRSRVVADAEVLCEVHVHGSHRPDLGGLAIPRNGGTRRQRPWPAGRRIGGAPETRP